MNKFINENINYYRTNEFLEDSGLFAKISGIIGSIVVLVFYIIIASQFTLQTTDLEQIFANLFTTLISGSLLWVSVNSYLYGKHIKKAYKTDSESHLIKGLKHLSHLYTGLIVVGAFILLFTACLLIADLTINIY